MPKIYRLICLLALWVGLGAACDISALTNALTGVERTQLASAGIGQFVNAYLARGMGYYVRKSGPDDFIGGAIPSASNPSPKQFTGSLNDVLWLINEQR